jgi:predicted Zn-dependent protease
MVQGLVRLILLAVMAGLAGCNTAPSGPPPELAMPADDPLAGSPAMSLVRGAESALQQGRPADAGEKLERALAMVPDSSWLYRLLAEQRLRRDDAAGAEGFARRALRHAPPDQPYYQAALRELLATALARQGQRAAAKDARARAKALRQP